MASLEGLGDVYSVEFWFWNGLPNDARDVTGYLFSRGADHAVGAPGDHLGIGGGDCHQGRLFFYNGDARGEHIGGATEITPRTWYHVVMVRDGHTATVYLNGSSQPELAGEAAVGHPPGIVQVVLGGRNDGLFGLEGKMAGAAVFDRVLTPEEVAAHYTAAGIENHVSGGS
jgi:hypothetical protein